MTDDEWDFYPCRVDDEPASIWVNLRYRLEDPSPENDHLHVAFFDMTSPGEHGMGTGEESELLGPIEDALFARVRAAGGEPVAHLRGKGVWQVCAYGPADLPWTSWVLELASAQAEVQSKPDAEFSYLNEFLLPDDERMQWIMDRRVCEQLEEHGDDHSVPRPVDHFIDCEGQPPQALIEAATKLGFEAHASEDGLQLVKTHPVELAVIHEIVMELHALAEAHGAEYDGWGCPVQSN